MNSTLSSSVLEAALFYARRGWPVNGHARYLRADVEALRDARRVEVDTARVPGDLESYLEQAHGFRANLIEKDQPWNPKNENYARCIESVLEHFKALPSDDPTLEMLAASDCNFEEDWVWQSLIHCQTDDPAAWLRDLASSFEPDEKVTAAD